jgi:hypothetical protein
MLQTVGQVGAKPEVFILGALGGDVLGDVVMEQALCLLLCRYCRQDVE